MRQDYSSVCDVRFIQQKKYLLKICQKEDLKDALYNCMSTQQFKQLMSIETVKKQFYISALKALYQASDYEMLEYHLVMMNSLFDYDTYEELKKDLLKRICKKRITIDEYCVIRHLIHFKELDFHSFIETLHIDFFVDEEECAKICLIEDEYHEAYFYLKRLDSCQNENILNLLRSYSFYDYLSLMKHYSRKKRVYQLVPSH